jgi:hypothetical protein
MSNFNEIAYVKWHENGYITIVVDNDSTYTSICPVVKHEWRGHKGKAAWDCDYWDLSKEEIAWLNSIVWE